MYKSTCLEMKECSALPTTTLLRSVSDTAKSVYESIMPFEEEELKVPLASDDAYPVTVEGWKRERRARRKHRARLFKKLTFSEEDLEAIVDEEESFQDMKRALRNKGCTTNLFLQQSLHHYVYHLKRRQYLRAQEEHQNRCPSLKVEECRFKNNGRNAAA